MFRAKKCVKRTIDEAPMSKDQDMDDLKCPRVGTVMVGVTLHDR